jgi:hypothetical protein
MNTSAPPGREPYATPRYLLIAGTPKAGTTSLFRYLSDHPQVCAANRKETYFFARDFDYLGTCRLGETRADFDSYFSHCSAAGQLRLEATPYTLYASEAAQRIAAVLADPLVLFILRDPVSRLFSDYRFHVQREHPAARGSFGEFVEAQRGMKTVVPNLIELGCYAEFLPAFDRAFGRERVILLLFEELTARPQVVVQDLCRSIGLDPSFYQGYDFLAHNFTVNRRSARLSRAMIRLEPVVAELRARALRHRRTHELFEHAVNLGKRTYRRLNDQRPAEPEQIPPDLYQRLADFYRPSTEALARRLGRALPWKSATA